MSESGIHLAEQYGKIYGALPEHARLSLTEGLIKKFWPEVLENEAGVEYYGDGKHWQHYRSQRFLISTIDDLSMRVAAAAWNLAFSMREQKSTIKQIKLYENDVIFCLARLDEKDAARGREILERKLIAGERGRETIKQNTYNRDRRRCKSYEDDFKKHADHDRAIRYAAREEGCHKKTIQRALNKLDKP